MNDTGLLHFNADTESSVGTHRGEGYSKCTDKCKNIWQHEETLHFLLYKSRTRVPRSSAQDLKDGVTVSFRWIFIGFA